MRGKIVLALFGAVMMVATSAPADHTQVTYSLSDDSANAHSDATVTVDYGTDRPASGTTHLEADFLVAHADGHNSPLTPNPDNGDIVGQGTATAEWWLTFCSEQTMSFDAKWVDPMDGSEPTGAVAQINLVTSLGFTIKSYVVRTSGHGYGTNHYDLVVPDFGDRACTGSNVKTSVTTYGTVPGSNPTRYVGRNPSTAGDYDIWSVYTDRSGVDHETTVTVTIT